MQDVDSESAFFDFDLLSDDGYLSEDLSLSVADEKATSNEQNQPADISEPTGGLYVPSSSTSGGVERYHDQYGRCLANVLDAFPGISSEYVRELYNTWMKSSQFPPHPHDVVQAFQGITLDILDATKPYPKEKDRTNELKRKRSQAINSDEEDMTQWQSDRKGQERDGYMLAVTWVLMAEFVNLPARIILSKIKEESSCYAAYLALAKEEQAFENAEELSYSRLKQPRKRAPSLSDSQRGRNLSYSEPELRRELQAAKDRVAKIRAKRKAEADAVEAEAAAEKLQRDNGEVFECQCCYDEFTMNKITHCDGETIHYFCLDCAKRNADNEIGKMRYKLICMSGDVCTASFSQSERHRFLDEKTLKALDRIQVLVEVKEAGVEIVWCPFCDFGAMCPPVYLDKEFRCQNTDCGKVSCRKCKVESHIPYNCIEWRTEHQLSERHLLEEARTAALIKKCPKCDVPIIKDHGCNRLTCPCGGTMCDVCGKDITTVGYGHFKRDDGDGKDDKRCPTFDDSDARRQDALKTAEADAIKEVRARNPDISPDDLKMQFHDDAPSVKPAKPMIVHRRRDGIVGLAAARAAAEARVAAIRPLGAKWEDVIRVDRPARPYGGWEGVNVDRASLQLPLHPGVAPPAHLFGRAGTRQIPPQPAILPGTRVVTGPFAANPGHAHPSHLPAFGPITPPPPPPLPNNLYPQPTHGPHFHANPHFEAGNFPEGMLQANNLPQRYHMERVEERLQRYNELTNGHVQQGQRHEDPSQMGIELNPNDRAPNHRTTLSSAQTYRTLFGDQGYKDLFGDQNYRDLVGAQVFSPQWYENQRQANTENFEKRAQGHTNPVEDRVQQLQGYDNQRHLHRGFGRDRLQRHERPVEDQIRRAEKPAQDRNRKFP